MVNPLSIVFMVCSTVVIFLLPLGLTIYLYKKEKISLKAIAIGALVFTVFQFLTRIPLLTVLNQQPWFQGLMTNLLFSAVLVGGLSAGLFEEIGRYLGFRFLLKKELSWGNGVAYGIGHGGIEAIGLVGLSYINNIIFSLMINAGTFDSLVGSQLGAETAALIKNQLINTAPALFLVGGLERLFAMLIQIALSLVVLYGVMKRKIIYLFYAILLHALVNASSVILLQQGLGIWVTELAILVFAIAAAFFIKRSRRLFSAEGARR